MKVLIVNDDGFDAMGIQMIFKAFEKYHPTLVAPKFEQSAKGHSFTMDRPLRLEQVGERQFSVDGSPADCTYLALNHVCPDVDVVVSGINHGANLGSDVFYSGTVAAAREGFLQGRHAFSFSMREDVSFTSPEEREAVYQKAADLALRLVEEFVQQPTRHHWNINFPARALLSDKPIEIVCKPMGQRHYRPTAQQRIDHRGRDYFWIGGPPMPLQTTDTDIYWCEQGKIVCTPLVIDCTSPDWSALSAVLPDLNT